MTTLTKADRTILAATRFYCDCTDAYCSLRSELDRAVEQILAAREAALLDRLGDEAVVEAATKAFLGLDVKPPLSDQMQQVWNESADDARAALAAVRAELLRQGGEEE